METEAPSISPKSILFITLAIEKEWVYGEQGYEKGFTFRDSLFPFICFPRHILVQRIESWRGEGNKIKKESYRKD